MISTGRFGLYAGAFDDVNLCESNLSKPRTCGRPKLLRMIWQGETTGIGSLPHQEIDAALDYAFAHSVPYLPQLTVGHPSEWMLALATSPALEPQERAWAAFLERLRRRQPRVAKVQLAGPLTLARYVGHIGTTRLIEKALYQVEAVKRLGVTPMFFVDEPGLPFAERFDALADVLSAVSQAGAITGVHCCGQAEWARVLALPSLDVLSFDFALSGSSVLAHATQFIERGGTLAFGLDVMPEVAPLETRSWLLTTSCGLGRATVAQADQRLALLNTFRAKRTKAGATHAAWPREK